MNWPKILTIVTGVSGFVSALAIMPFDIEKLPLPPEAKGWIATIGAGITALAYTLKQFIPLLERLAATFTKSPPETPPVKIGADGPVTPP